MSHHQDRKCLIEEIQQLCKGEGNVFNAKIIFEGAATCNDNN